MSKHQMEITVPVSPEAAVAACRQAATTMGWSIQAQNITGITCQEVVTNPFSFTTPVTAELSVTGFTGGQSTLSVNGSNLGLGPIQSSHVKKELGKLCDAVKAAAARPAAVQTGTQAAHSASSAPAVVINGRQLTDEQIALAGTYGVRLSPGNYWYDRIMGAWGYAGGPTAGFILAGLDLGGELQENASNGNTGVFINGRNLPLMDVAALQTIVPMVWPGRYWMDAQGNFGWQGGMMLGNVWSLAASSGAPREGILSTYDKTGATVIG